LVFSAAVGLEDCNQRSTYSQTQQAFAEMLPG
jgi:hypothetical protein